MVVGEADEMAPPACREKGGCYFGERRREDRHRHLAVSLKMGVADGKTLLKLLSTRSHLYQILALILIPAHKGALRIGSTAWSDISMV